MIIDRFLPHSNMTNVYTFTNFSSRNKAKKKVTLFQGIAFANLQSRWNF